MKCTPEVRPKNLTSGVIFMTKYDFAFKQKVVHAYLAGEGGYPTIAKRFGIPSDSTVVKWVRLFKELGQKGLLRRKNNKSYPVQFKLNVLDYKLRTGETFQATALKYGMTEPSIIANWMKAWSTKGIEGLSNLKGRPSMSNKPKKKMTREQQLEKEVELLRAENAYLKKLRASGINIPSRLLKQNQESFKNSDKNSD